MTEKQVVTVDRSVAPPLRASALLPHGNYRNLCTGNYHPELYSLAKNRIHINASPVLDIVLDRLEGSRIHANI